MTTKRNTKHNNKLRMRKFLKYNNFLSNQNQLPITNADQSIHFSSIICWVYLLKHKSIINPTKIIDENILNLIFNFCFGVIYFALLTTFSDCTTFPVNCLCPMYFRVVLNFLEQFSLLTAFSGYTTFSGRDAFSTTLSPLTHNGEAAWRRRGEHYRLLEPQTVKFPTKGH